MNDETIARTILRQAHNAALLTDDNAKLSGWVNAWNRLMPYGYHLVAVLAKKDDAGTMRCDVWLADPQS